MRRRPIQPVRTATRSGPCRDGRARKAAGAGVDPAVSRLLLDAQEDLRREIARAMHDGPAQSLTNIVLQAQIVERLVASDPTSAEPRGPRTHRDGPAQPGSHQVVHLRRPADGPRRPRPRADPAAGHPRARPSGPVSRSTSIPWGRTVACRWTSRPGCSGSWTRRWRPTSRARPIVVTVRLDWAEQFEARVTRLQRDRPRQSRLPTPETAPRRRPAAGAGGDDGGSTRGRPRCRRSREAGRGRGPAAVDLARDRGPGHDARAGRGTAQGRRRGADRRRPAGRSTHRCDRRRRGGRGARRLATDAS